ncbi:MAG TPA: hypothetical protein VK731_00620 [Candidatus Cybelea sp.]|jgi:hypothetical protein|nr:hypothetical protein [Candidatus Cybelea sp.]
MQKPRAFVLFGSLILSVSLSLDVQAGPLKYTVSADASANAPGVFIGLSGQWNSGDLALPSGTTIGSTPLEIDITLSQNLTLNDAGGFELDGWGLAGFDPGVASGADAGDVRFELLEGTTVVTPKFGSDFGNPFSFPLTEYTTASGAILPVKAVFNAIDVFITDANQESVTDFEVSLNTTAAPAVPDTSNTMLLLLGCGALFGLGRYRALGLCRQASR